MYDIVRVYFTNGTSTLLHVSEDDEVRGKIQVLCEQYGWDPKTVAAFKITGQIEDQYETTGQLEDR